MNQDQARYALLPAGLHDALPHDAAFESDIARRLLESTARFGYDLVKPPLVEFEEGLLTGAGAATAAQTFRLMDPVSQRMMGVRADMTPQIGRIATTRLAAAPRPLRLSYAGDVLQVKGSQLRPERQFTQVGIELIGATELAADAEVLLVAAESLRAVGVRRLSADLNLPSLVPQLAAELGVGPDRLRGVLGALGRRDAAAVAAIGGKAGALLGGLLAASGPAAQALEGIAALDLPAAAARLCRDLAEVVDLMRAADPGLALTVDPVEHRGFEYHTGISFTLFAIGVRGELGRGGRYQAGANGGEPATGFTLYMDTLLRALPDRPQVRRILLTHGTPTEVGQRLRREGWGTVQALAPTDNAPAEARRMGCGHVLLAGTVTPVEG